MLCMITLTLPSLLLHQKMFLTLPYLLMFLPTLLLRRASPSPCMHLRLMSSKEDDDVYERLINISLTLWKHGEFRVIISII